jgi:hypothetical protein
MLYWDLNTTGQELKEQGHQNLVLNYSGKPYAAEGEKKVFKSHITLFYIVFARKLRLV